MYDSDELRALAKAALRGSLMSAETTLHQAMTPETVFELLDEIELLRKDKERLDFTESASTTWYPGRAANGYGILCYDIKGRHRAEAIGKTMREAIDVARTQGGDACK